MPPQGNDNDDLDNRTFRNDRQQESARLSRGVHHAKGAGYSKVHRLRRVNHEHKTHGAEDDKGRGRCRVSLNSNKDGTGDRNAGRTSSNHKAIPPTIDFDQVAAISVGQKTWGTRGPYLIIIHLVAHETWTWKAMIVGRARN